MEIHTIAGLYIIITDAKSTYWMVFSEILVLCNDNSGFRRSGFGTHDECVAGGPILVTIDYDRPYAVAESILCNKEHIQHQLKRNNNFNLRRYQHA